MTEGAGLIEQHCSDGQVFGTRRVAVQAGVIAEMLRDKCRAELTADELRMLQQADQQPFPRIAEIPKSRVDAWQ